MRSRLPFVVLFCRHYVSIFDLIGLVKSTYMETLSKSKSKFLPVPLFRPCPLASSSSIHPLFHHAANMCVGRTESTDRSRAKTNPHPNSLSRPCAPLIHLPALRAGHVCACGSESARRSPALRRKAGSLRPSHILPAATLSCTALAEENGNGERARGDGNGREGAVSWTGRKVPRSLRTDGRINNMLLTVRIANGQSPLSP